MSTHVIRFGGAPMTLTKSSRHFTLFQPDSEAIAALIKDSRVVGLHNATSGLWRVALDEPGILDEYMAKSRELFVVHHEYHVERPGFRTRFIPTDRINVRLGPRASPDYLDRLVELLSLDRMHAHSTELATLRVTNRTGMNPIKVCEKLAGDDAIEYCEPDFFQELRRMDSPVPRYFGRQWHLHGRSQDDEGVVQGISIEQAWQITRGSREIVVAVFDDGFDLTNPDLQGNVVHPSDFAPLAGLDDDDGPIEPADTKPLANHEIGDFHGTPCAGLAIGRARENIAGVAPDCSWMPVRTRFGLVPQDTTLRIFEYLSPYTDVVSCSWGVLPSPFERPSSALLDTMRSLIERGGRRGNGLVVCFAAGNENLPTSLQADNNPNGFEYFDYGGNKLGTFFKRKDMHSSWCEVPGVINVGSVTPRSRKALYSNWGNELTVVAPSNNRMLGDDPDQPKFASRKLVTTDNELHGRGLHEVGLAESELGAVTDGMGGTSGATPQVAGVCALMISANPSLSAAEVRHLLATSADKTAVDLELDNRELPNNDGQTGKFDALTGRSIWFGHGLVDPERAVRAAMAHGPVGDSRGIVQDVPPS